MVLSESVLVKNNKKYKKIGYGDDFYINIKIEDLTKGSHVLVSVKCDYCDNIREIPYKKYNNSILNNNKYSCSYKCRSLKTKEINLEKYGVECNLHSDKGREQVKKTNIKKYGTEHPMQSNIIKEKIITTNLEKYGVNSYVESEQFKEKYKKISLEKYGTEHPMQSEEYKKKYVKNLYNKYNVINIFQLDSTKFKIKETNLEKYYVEYYSQTEEFKIKFKETNLEKYGVEHYSKTSEFKEKIGKTNLNKYGFKYFFQTNKFKEMSIITNIEKYGVYNYTKSEECKLNTLIGKNINYIKYIDKSISLFNCIKGHTFEINSDNYQSRIKQNIPLCTICNPIGDSRSIKEKDLFEFIQSNYNNEVISSYRDGLEIDIFLPELNLGFEFNGLYWHSEKFKDKNYHLNKTNHFKEKGIRIIHIWEDDWVFKLEIIKSQINNLLKLNTKKIFARKCVVKEIKDSRIATKFLNDNHIQGKVNSSLKLGLYYLDELVSIMTFDHFEGRKKMEEGGWNLNRFCNLLNTNVIGSASKLLSYFIKNYEVSRIVSYADKDWSIGNLYEVLEFKKVNESLVDYKYIVDNQRVHKSRYRKDKLGIKGINITESQKMKELNIYKIYDCGKIKFEKVDI